MTGSVKVRPINGCGFGVAFSIDAQGGIGIIVDGSGNFVGYTNTAGIVSLTNYKILPLKNGLFKVTVTVKVTANTTVPLKFFVIVDQALTTTWGWSYLGANNAIETCDWKLTKGNYEDGDVPTNGSAYPFGSRDL